MAKNTAKGAARLGRLMKWQAERARGALKRVGSQPLMWRLGGEYTNVF